MEYISKLRRYLENPETIGSTESAYRNLMMHFNNNQETVIRVLLAEKKERDEVIDELKHICSYFTDIYYRANNGGFWGIDREFLSKAEKMSKLLYLKGELRDQFNEINKQQATQPAMTSKMERYYQKMRSGERKPASKGVPYEVIRDLRSQNLSHQEIADRVGLSRSAVSKILKGMKRGE